MISKRLGGVCAALGLAFGLAGCVDDYGYGGMEVGYGNAGYYGDPYYDGYGYSSYGPSYYGWYGDYYYPGTGIYVYDQYRRPYRWNDTQRRYWSGQQRYRGRDWNRGGSWNGFDRRTQPGYTGNRQWQGNSQWQGNRNGYVPQGNATNQGYRRWQGNGGTPGAQSNRGDPSRQGYRGTGDGNRTYTAPPTPRGSGQWSGRTGRAARNPEQ